MKRMKHVIGISEMKITSKADDILITYSLGSCLGLSLYDPEAGVGGMIHCMLPLSKIDPAKAQRTPSMFVDTGVPKLLQKLFDAGATRKNLVAKVAGCGQLMDEKKLFKIGERNYTVLRKILWKNNILIAAEDVYGTVSRTMALYMESGKTTLKVGGKEREL
jgi:chemotaxis protein CheD